MTDHVICIPYVDQRELLACSGSMDDECRSRVTAFDNRPPHNQGVAHAWNKGILWADEIGAQFLTLCSSSMRFGPVRRVEREGVAVELGAADGGRALCRTADLAGSQKQWPWGFESLNGWHLFTLGRKTWEAIGLFDERFFPAYFEDNDYIWRMRCAGILEPRGEYFKGHPDFEDFSVRRIPWVGAIDYELTQDATSIKSGLVSVDMETNRRLYVDKWGGEPGHERTREPYT